MWFQSNLAGRKRGVSILFQPVGFGLKYIPQNHRAICHNVSEYKVIVEVIILFEPGKIKGRVLMLQKPFKHFNILIRGGAVLFGKHNIYTDGFRVRMMDLFYQVSHNGPGPGPLTDPVKAFFINIDNSDGVGGCNRATPPEHGIDHLIVQCGQKGRFHMPEGIEQQTGCQHHQTAGFKRRQSKEFERFLHHSHFFDFLPTHQGTLFPPKTPMYRSPVARSVWKLPPMASALGPK